MSMFGKLADRLLEKMAPSAEADAACIFLRKETTQVGWCAGSSIPRTPRYRYTYIYDNCADRVTYSCSA
jgi:hypothetical protein